MRLLLISGESEWSRELVRLLSREDGVFIRAEYAGQLKGKWAEHFWNRLVDQYFQEDAADAILLCLWQRVELMEILPRLGQSCSLPVAVMGSRSGKTAYYEEVRCLEQGADDYIRPAAEAPVILLRLQKLIDLYQGVRGGLSLWHGLEEREGEYFWQGISLGLTRKESQVLQELMHSRQETVTRERLLRRVWKAEKTGDRYSEHQEAALTTMIKGLRKKLASTPVRIIGRYGKGYGLEVVPPESRKCLDSH